MTSIATLFAALVILLGLGAPASAGSIEDCAESEDPQRRIRGCTELIGTIDWSEGDLEVVKTLGSMFYNNRGLGYAELGDLERAIRDYDEASRLNPKDPFPYNNRGIANSDLGKHGMAIEDFNLALKLAPNFFQARVGRGGAHFQQGEFRQALRDFDEAARLVPDFAPNHLNRGASLLRLEDYRGALEAYDRALRLRPDYVAALWGRSNAQCLLGLINESIDSRMEAFSLASIEIESVQRRLKAKGFYKGAVDGDFGPASKRALRAWTKAGCPGIGDEDLIAR